MATLPRKSFRLPESYPHYPRGREFHVEHVAIALSVDMEGRRIDGSCKLLLKPLRGGIGRISLDACEMEVSKVEVDGATREFEYDGQKLTVRVPEMGMDTHAVIVWYSASPKDGIYFIGPDEKYPQKPVQAWTHGEAEFARHWYPCYDSPDDKSTTETEISVPSGYAVISNGELLSRRESGGRVTYHWRENRPHSSYLTSFVAGRFGEVKEESEGVPLYYYFPESKREDVGRYFGETPRMIRVYNEITGVKYPYAKYAQTTVEDFIFGGMENVDATTLTTSRFHDASSDEDFQGSYGTPNRDAVNLVAHELAHQWFGDLVTCSDWSHAWLNEGFADYMQVMYIERTRGVDAARWDMQVKAQEALDEDEEDYRRPIVEKDMVYADDMFDGTTYEKGAWMIHELRYIMGDEPFFRGIKEYLTRFSFKNADTHDFRKVMEEVSGVPLERFFEQAFLSPGYPEFEAGYSWDDVNRSATVTVKQVQARDDGTPVFTLPCDLVFYTARGREKRRVQIHGADQAFTFQLESEPTIVEFDPEERLFKKLSFRKGVTLLLSQLERSEDASSRAVAARELGTWKTGQSVRALTAAALREQFWYVNACAVRALGEISSQESLSALLSIGKPAHRKVRRAFAEALGHFNDEKAVAVLEDLLETDPSPYVRCEAALALAKSAGAKAVPALTRAMAVHSPNETLAEACLAAMGRVDTEETKEIVLRSLEYGNPTRVRIGAMKAIKERGRFTEEELPLLKRVLLKDKEYGVRDYLAGKLIPAVGDGRMLEALLESSRGDRDNRVRRSSLEAYHQISSREETSKVVSGLRAEIEKLKGAGSPASAHIQA